MSTSTILAGPRRLSASLVLAIIATICGAGSASMGAAAQAFETPEAAVDAFIAAVRQDDLPALVTMLGEGADQLLESGDPVQDANRRERFLALFDEHHELQPVDDDRMALVIGADAWPYPIPLVKTGTGWSFDVESGIEEIVNRRVGENELFAIQACLAVVDAQREYYSRDHDGDGLLEYAQTFRSTVGRRDGLFWPAREGEPESPLGELAAAAAAEGYSWSSGGYHGYHYRLLTAQGPGAPGGAYDFLARDDQIGGFAVLAFPAAYGDSGVMSFMTSHAGVVYQADLGPDTASLVEQITVFDPVEPWHAVPDGDLEPLPALR